MGAVKTKIENSHGEEMDRKCIRRENVVLPNRTRTVIGIYSEQCQMNELANKHYKKNNECVK